MICGFWWTNAWNTGYLPINNNHIFDNTGARYNVSKILDDRAILSESKYQEYSEPHMVRSDVLAHANSRPLVT